MLQTKTSNGSHESFSKNRNSARCNVKKCKAFLPRWLEEKEKLIKRRLSLEVCRPRSTNKSYANNENFAFKMNSSITFVIKGFSTTHAEAL
ncbi:CLUMA_CG006783, isoform A [Clunio marinus]|uniref:CLUMA_CG006783, isoform A n=1 Tax=Clunio marinus TaxID=568069 RepID=A0A1J1HYR5_9DIPT|nr:CLUMA_CG006783, isoform A [Clunio marinus]